MTRPTLSICIPTYNRGAFLEDLLSRLSSWHFDFPIEVVVSDNASTDNTQEIVKAAIARGQPVSYHRHGKNQGALANIFSAYRRASGEYVMYVADDDLLIPEAVCQTVRFLQANPRVVAAYAPWVIYDDVKGEELGQFYSLPSDVVFEQDQDAELLQFVVQRHVFPEIFILRGDAVGVFTNVGHFSFQHFVDFTRIYGRGPVAFLTKPFYRSVTNSRHRRDREQMGIEHVMTEWDDYRGGLEYFIYHLLKRNGQASSPEGGQTLRTMIEAFLDARMSVAQRLWLGRHDFLRAYEILCRRRFLNPLLVAEEANQIGNLRQLVVWQILARLAGMIAGIERIVLGDIDVTNVEGMLRQCGLDPRIAVVEPPAEPTAHVLQTTLVLIQQQANRQRYLDQGYPRGLIVTQDDLAAAL